MAKRKRTNNDIQNITKKTKDRATRIPHMQVRVQSDLAQKHFIYFHIIDPVFKYIL
jgi:hypothetical protein